MPPRYKRAFLKKPTTCLGPVVVNKKWYGYLRSLADVAMIGTKDGESSSERKLGF
jgi:hypothetical protein